MSEPQDIISIAVADGKYTVIQDASGKLKALRNGEPWRDCVGDGLILALAYELEEAREQRAELLNALKKAIAHHGESHTCTTCQEAKALILKIDALLEARKK